ncbi:response regulator [Azospirillum halopraeferens]|uniref:response regulator n=1 Tax=Azospirillum halopraeferens TaxID=34010 RepID=UPI0003F87E29|nr:response regulator [Azospirillum halopraeferens]
MGNAAAGRLIVVVDDDPSIVEGLGMILETWGYDVLTAQSAEELSGSLGTLTEPPALVLADHFLPGGHTGADVVAMVRRHCNATVPAIVLTGDTTPERRAEADAAGCRLLHKPVLPNALKAAVEDLIA